MLDPDMPLPELLLHFGELTEDEVLVARAAIRLANNYKQPVTKCNDIDTTNTYDLEGRN